MLLPGVGNLRDSREGRGEEGQVGQAGEGVHHAGSSRQCLWYVLMYR